MTSLALRALIEMIKNNNSAKIHRYITPFSSNASKTPVCVKSNCRTSQLNMSMLRILWTCVASEKLTKNIPM